MDKTKLAAHSRSQLDKRFNQIGPLSRFKRAGPRVDQGHSGSLGMSSEQLATRLGIKQPSVVALEQSEAKGTIELATLRARRQALDCMLVYALVPNKPLETSSGTGRAYCSAAAASQSSIRCC